MKTSILVSVGAAGVFVAAVVLASPMSTQTGGSPASVPNRADLHVAATCDSLAPVTASVQPGWHTALATKRALDRNLVLVSAAADPANGCGLAGN
jgi:hypothetical protein